MAVEVRSFQTEDFAGVIDLMNISLGGGPVGRRTEEFFRWKHIDNLFGRSHILVAEAGGKIVGVRPFLRWRFFVDGRIIRAVRAVDTAIHPDFQRRGLFSTMTRRSLQELSDDTDLVFNTPNPKSLPGYLKMGWERVGEVPVAVRIRRPLRFVRRLTSQGNMASEPEGAANIPRAEEALADDRSVEALIDGLPIPRARLSTFLTVDYLRWRYSAPDLDYRAVVRGHGDEIASMGIFRLRSRASLNEATVCELLGASGRAKDLRILLKDVDKAAAVDHITCHFSAAPRGLGLRSGFLTSPRGLVLVVKPLRKGMIPDPRIIGSWALSLGDLEVF